VVESLHQGGGTKREKKGITHCARERDSPTLRRVESGAGDGGGVTGKYRVGGKSRTELSPRGRKSPTNGGGLGGVGEKQEGGKSTEWHCVKKRGRGSARELKKKGGGRVVSKKRKKESDCQGWGIGGISWGGKRGSENGFGVLRFKKGKNKNR